MNALREKMIRDMQLRRLADRTQEAYLDRMTCLAKHYKRSPDQITDRELQDFILFQRNERQMSWSTCNQFICAIRFFYGVTLGRTSARSIILGRRIEQRLPEILSSQELVRLFAAAGNLKHRTMLKTVYAAGLRRAEAAGLKVSDIDSDRMMIRVEQGKGRKDRYTTLSPQLLLDLREYWRKYRPAQWLFTADHDGGPLADETLYTIYMRAKEKAGIRKTGGIHALRHSFATHMIEAGVDLRTLQELMGHRSFTTTLRYLHVTRKSLGSPENPLDLLAINVSKRPPTT